MTNSIIILRTGISPEDRQSRYSDDSTRLQEPVENLRTLALMGKTGYWSLKLEKVQGCREVHIYNWQGTQRLVAPIIPQECYCLDMFGKVKTVIAFDPKAVRFERVDPPRKFGQCSAFYQSEVGDEISEPDDDSWPAPFP